MKSVQAYLVAPYMIIYTHKYKHKHIHSFHTEFDIIYQTDCSVKYIVASIDCIVRRL